MDLRIEQPLWLLLGILPLVYFIWVYRKQKNHNGRVERITFWLRVVTIGILLTALTNPYMKWPTKEEQILFLVDQSASMKNTDQDIQTFLQEAVEARKSSQEVGIFSFNRSFSTDQKLSSAITSVPKLTELSGIEATNIEQAVQLSTALIDSKKATRLVLLTDGNETEGNVMRAVEQVKGQSVEIDTFELTSSSNEDVSLIDFQTPTTAFQNESHILTVTAQSAKQTAGTLTIYLNDQPLITDQVSLSSGQNVFSYDYKAKETGVFHYKATLTVLDDSVLQNNTLSSLTMVEHSPHILVVSPNGDSPIDQFISSDQGTMESITAAYLPSDLASYASTDAIIFDNVPGHLVGEAKMAVIEQAVKQFGMGFMMVGGEQSFGLGGYFQTPIERILPVNMDVQGKHQLPSLGLMIVLDRSGSMMGGKLDLAKEAAARSVEMLRDEDQLGFIAFDDRPWEIIEAGPIKDKEETLNKILAVTPGGGTEIYTSLASAYEKIEMANVQRKHIILLTDGQSATSNDYESLITEGLSKNITLSTVSIGQDADRNLLQMLAEFGTGRFYDVVDETTIPSILSRETAMVTKTYIEDEPFYPTIYDSQDWRTVFTDGVPQLNAYIATTLKEKATLIAETPKEDPLLSEWMYGLGRTIAYTSDSRGAWSGDFARYQKWQDFWNVAVSRLLPSIQTAPFHIERESENTYVLSDPSGQSQFFDVSAVTNKGQELEIESQPLEPGKVRVKVKTDPGIVFFNVRNEQNTSFRAGISIPYSKEYELKKPNEELLKRVSAATGGEVITSGKEAMRKIDSASFETQSMQIALLFVALGLFFIDITLRRFGLPNWRRWTRAKVGQEEVVAEETSISSVLERTKRKRER